VYTIAHHPVAVRELHVRILPFGAEDAVISETGAI
jgi:hypothetical protein